MVSIMCNLSISIVDYTDTVSVYVNDDLLGESSLSLFGDAKYTCVVLPGVYKVRITKNSELLGKQWKKKAALDWLSSLSGIPDFTLREAMLDTKQCSICFSVNVTDMDQAIDVKLTLNSSGFEIIQGIEKCSSIQIENSTDNTALRRFRVFYLLPGALLLVMPFGLLIYTALFFLIKTQFQLFLLVLVLTVALAALLVYAVKSW